MSDPRTLPYLEEAMEWLARERSDQFSTADQSRLESWLAEDEAHRRAYFEAHALYAEMDDAVPQLAQRATNEEVPPRNIALRWGAIAATLLALIVGWVVLSQGPAGETYQTAAEEQMQVRLPDGSLIELNANTQLTSAYDSGSRRIRLVNGEAFFEVASEPARPFVVQIGGRQVRAVGTAFNIRRTPVGASVTVSEGIVELDQDTRLPVTISAGQVAVFNESGLTGPVQTAPLTRALAWRDGQLKFSQARLADVIAEMNRYFATPVGLADPTLANIEITGSFQLGQQAEFLMALQAVAPIRSEADQGRIYIYFAD